ncbi:MAG: hypothetical protein ABJ242_04435 [Marinomonas sp.]
MIQASSDMYSIKRDTSKNRVIILFDGARDYNVDVFFQEFMEAANFAKCARPHFDALVDHSRTNILPQERTKHSEAMALWCLENGLRRSANIVSSAVMRMQLKRVTDSNPHFAYFQSREDAEAWLDAEAGLPKSA